ncbi:elongation of very long chain fatty acids protein [Sporobolomyces koalae]|uniref:elongation of very long chain fatty acids protein n=1 Tax=Sporobolomyces koalae TaxID=500713 RepID=UPI00317FBD92
MDQHNILSSTQQSASMPRASSFLAALADSPKPRQPEHIPFPSAYETFMNPLTPFIFGIVYFAVAKTLSHYQNGRNRIQGKRWNVVVVAHNVFLAVYSAWTFLSTAPQVIGSFASGFSEHGFAGLLHAFCDSEHSVWGSQQFPRFTYMFYLSKFYEIVDTAILLLKGKKVGMLQSYHHTGAIWTMYAAYRTQTMAVWLFVLFNSAVHSIMYCYYAITALSLPFPRFLKKSITRMQITQFLVGGSLAASYLFIKLPELSGAEKAANVVSNFSGTMSTSLEQGMLALRRETSQCLINPAQRAAVWLNVAYLIPLTYLFAAFFIKSYRRGAKPTKAASDAAVKAKKTA